MKISSSNRYYPVVLYPKLLLKFLGESTGATKENRIWQPSKGKKERIRQVPGSIRLAGYFGLIWVTVALVIVMRLWLNPNWYVVGTAFILSLALALVLVALVHYWLDFKPASPLKPVRPALTATPSKRQDLKLLLTDQVLKPTHQGQAPVGVAEDDFLIKLQQYFQVHTGQQFAIPDTELCYTPDFLIVHPPTGLTIDVECDEPYEGKTLTPHHCLDDGKDARRDRFFLDGNIAVIRFAEEQIVRYPDSCCQLIAEVIAEIAGDTGALDRFSSLPKLPPQPRWHRRQAQRMAKTHYRREYLPWR
jgi:hypothetical protein